MVRVCGKEIDPDVALAYNTFKMVTIKDRWLGILHHGFQCGILIYIIVGVIFLQLQFLAMSPAYGALRLSLLRPSSHSTVPSYCSTTNHSTLSFPQKLPCLYQDPAVVNVGANQLFITTHITVSEVKINCTGSTIYSTETTCDSAPIVTISGPTEFFIGDIEDTDMTIDHSPISLDVGISLSQGVQIVGELQHQASKGSNTWKTYPGVSFSSLQEDTIPLATLMDACYLDLEDVGNSYLESDEADYLSSRYFGSVVLFVIEYSNTDVTQYWKNVAAGADTIKYTYKPIVIPEIDDFVVETVYVNYPTHWYNVERRGIRVVGQITGELGRFKFQTLLIQLTTSLALMKMATLLVDTTAIYLLPRKFLYRKAKFEETVDFSTLMAKITELEKQPGKQHVNVQQMHIIDDTSSGRIDA